ncbi:MAG TPA: hypothetical protein DCY94_05040, partial [Firmicutes bacterium]|nr:hypothetical protein [Bacillota bacterium]
VKLMKENRIDPKLNENNIKNKTIKEKIFLGLIVLTLFFTLTTFVRFTYNLLKLNLLPLKYLVIGFIVIAVVLIPMVVLICKKNHYVLKSILIVLLVGMSSGCLFVNDYLKSTNDFLSKTQNKENKLVYKVIVKKDSEISKIENLKNKDISVLGTDAATIKDHLTFSYNENIKTGFIDLVHDLLDEKTDAIVLENGYYMLAIEEVESFEDDTKVIYTFDLETEEDLTAIDNTEIAVEPFVLYISGIDQRGNISSVRGRSDVNQLLVVNPKTHKILIVNTPRDYYVQLHGTTGLKDKLTHAGVYGINKSIETLEDLYDIDINHYIRVNFGALERLVDVIGGIDVYSDISFNMSHIKGRHVEKGMNHFNGREALAYSRERYAYTTGDNHRGENQQQVITAIIDKVTSSEILIKKYTEILKNLEGTFQTDLSSEDITSLVKMQLSEMPKWSIESYAVTGRGSSNYTYSMGTKYLLYVMEPNMSTVEEAKGKIKGVLNED